ncbi:MAG: polysaccharide deacetylase family protein [Bacteroidia bacterium]
MIPIRPPYLIRKYFNSLVWNIPTEEKIIYLTFDDGPIPDVTPWVIETLDQFNAKATFFCIGDNVKKHPGIFELIKSNKHAVGNHTFNHLSGWVTNDADYFENINKANELIQSKYFRAPYGRIKPSQIKFLKNHYKIIMWDVLSKDYDLKRTGESCYQNVIDYAQPGSVIVFHDSLKAKERLQYALPKVLEYYTERDFVFKVISV